MKEWLFLIGAIFLETFATSMLKYSEQFTKLLRNFSNVISSAKPFFPDFHVFFPRRYSAKIRAAHSTLAAQGRLL